MTAAEALAFELAKLTRIAEKALTAEEFTSASYDESGRSAAIACENALLAMASPNGVHGDTIRAAAILLVMFAVKARLETHQPEES